MLDYCNGLDMSPSKVLFLYVVCDVSGRTHLALSLKTPWHQLSSLNREIKWTVSCYLPFNVPVNAKPQRWKKLDNPWHSDRTFTLRVLLAILT